MTDAGDAGGGSRRRAARPVLVALLVLALAIVVTVVSSARGRGTIEAAPRDVPLGIFDYLFTLGVLLAVAAIAAAVLLRGKFVAPKHDPTGLVRLFLLMGPMLLLAWLVIRFGVGIDVSELELPEEWPEESDAEAVPGRERRPQALQFKWDVAAAVGVLAVLGGLGYLLARRRRRERMAGAEATLAAELAGALKDTVDDLRAERDPRRAVIAAYARMEAVLAAHGLSRRPSEAPLEYLARVLSGRLHVRADAAAALTALFERAKFSAHPVGPEMKEEAIAALVAVRDDLRAAA